MNLRPEDYASLAAEYRAKGVGIRELAEIMNVPGSRFYQRSRKTSRKEPANDSAPVSKETLITALKAACQKYPLYGYRRIRAILKREYGLVVSCKRVNRLMNKLGLSQDCLRNRSIVRIKDRPGKPSAPNQVWEMDMTKTYLDGYGWLNIIAIIDRFDRSIVGYEISSGARAIEWLQLWIEL